MLQTQNSANDSCPLCGSASSLFYENDNRVFYSCEGCSGIFQSRRCLPDKETEFARYKTHNNDVFDPRYQNFVAPIVSGILQDFTTSDQGLDFGAGARSVIGKLLRDNKYSTSEYDPFFQNDPELLESKYDYIACCEVIEHFHHPSKEFGLLKKLLNPKGRLYLMTDLFHDGEDFGKWYYKNDPTHVFFYRPETFKWIKENFKFSEVEVKGRLIIFKQ